MTAPALPPRKRQATMVCLLALLLGGGLQACADRPSVRPADFSSGTANPIQISRTRIAHEVTFSLTSSDLDPKQTSALFAFIAANSVGPKDSLLIEHGGALVDQAHAETLAARLTAIGLRPAVLASANVSSGVARVVLERYVAIAPDCPDWSHKPSHNYENYNQRNFGCADASNPAAMVADPKDLAMGASMGGQVGDPVTKPVADYRAGTPGGSSGGPGSAIAAPSAGGASGGSAPGSAPPTPTGP